MGVSNGKGFTLLGIVNPFCKSEINSLKRNSTKRSVYSIKTFGRIVKIREDFRTS